MCQDQSEDWLVVYEHLKHLKATVNGLMRMNDGALEVLNDHYSRLHQPTTTYRRLAICDGAYFVMIIEKRKASERGGIQKSEVFRKIPDKAPRLECHIL